VLVALGNPANAPAIVDAAIRLIGARRPAEVLLTRLIPTTRAPEFRTGLLEEEREVEAAIASMRPLVDQAAVAGVAARPISFISDDVGPDLARIAADQGCATMILGWHRASLPRHVIRALVHRVFTLAPCDVTIFVDREGHGIRTAGDGAGPVVVALNGSTHDAAAEQLGLDLAESLGATITLVGYVGADYGVTNEPETLVDQARELEQRGGIAVTPIFTERDGFDIALGEMAGAPVAVVSVGGDWQLDEDFGSTATRLVDSADCPVLVVRAAGMVDPAWPASRPKRQAVTTGD
jgi:nucleotide-binding universal stress UspA family protein